MSVESQISNILQRFPVVPLSYAIDRIGTGYIHYTYRISAQQSFILQRVNKNVFKQPEMIDANLSHASEFLKTNFPDFLFLTPLKADDGKTMVYDAEGFPWRLFPFIEHTFTIDKVSTPDQAFSAAKEFARLSKNLDSVNTSLFKPTIDRFHDLGWRYEQFQSAFGKGSSERKKIAGDIIGQAQDFQVLVQEYEELIKSGKLKPRITHNDTKINNILFDEKTSKAVCAIDLDTLMPGYFIYDLGDMIRTFVSPVDEDEKDVSKIVVRQDIYDAVVKGYLSEMDSVLSPDEKTAIRFSGLMMTYIMALRFLADYLNGDTYYQIRYPDHNLVRATNQFTLLTCLDALPELKA
jgi:Ser/Thr protein kinase RdoA (MazF antagonist)